MRPLYIASTKLALVFLAAIFGLEGYLAITEPIRTSEAYLYDRFVRPSTRQVFAQELPQRSVLYALLEKRSVGLFHVSAWSVRLPALLAGIMYLAAAWRLASRLLGYGRSFVVAVVAAGLAPLPWDCFSRADGVGLSLALALAAVAAGTEYLLSDEQVPSKTLNFTGACLGFCITARYDFWLPVAAIAAAFLAVLAWRRQTMDWVERLLVPAVATAFILLVLPASHSHAAGEVTPELSRSDAGRLQVALAVLRANAGSQPVQIAASPGIEPVANFYRAQHRLATWGRVTRDMAGESGYYLAAGAGGELLLNHHLLVLYRDADLVLARRDAPM